MTPTVIASGAKQSSAGSEAHGLLRRYAPRNDGAWGLPGLARSPPDEKGAGDDQEDAEDSDAADFDALDAEGADSV